MTIVHWYYYCYFIFYFTNIRSRLSQLLGRRKKYIIRIIIMFYYHVFLFIYHFRILCSPHKRQNIYKQNIFYWHIGAKKGPLFFLRIMYWFSFSTLVILKPPSTSLTFIYFSQKMMWSDSLRREDVFWNQTDVCFVPDQSKNGKHILISIWFNKISKKILCMYTCLLHTPNSCQTNPILVSIKFGHCSFEVA